MSENSPINLDSFKLIISREKLLFLESYSRQNISQESCAILLGKRTENEFLVLETILMENDEKSYIMFTINEDKLFSVYKKAESMNLSVVGIYHNHPAHPVPSITDKKYMETNPVPWIINSTITNESKCYIYYDSQGVRDVDIVFTD
ncbi:MAG TPA: Mov34/MPN/PAD-1 family protein [Verrucomicrobiae bacterium]|nr:Mov34/MPN/PAD-1 family protein [Verrucomicrobiae bacterium]